MSQTAKRGISKLTIRNRKEADGRISTGANTELLLDGEPLRGVRFIKIECKSTAITKVMLEMFVEVDAEVYVNLQESEPRKRGCKSGDKHYAIYNIGTPYPAIIAEKDEENS